MFKTKIFHFTKIDLLVPFFFPEVPVASSTTKIKQIKIKTLSNWDAYGAGCGECLWLNVCQSESCCSTEISPHWIWAGQTNTWPNNKLGDCKDFLIDKDLPIEFTFNHETSDGWHGEEATVHLHQNEQKPYKCPISEWLDDDESYTTTCDSPFIISENELKSPNYPNNYPFNIEKAWLLIAPDVESIITLEFITFHVRVTIVYI